MSEDAIICVICKKEEKDAKRVIECVYCHKCAHFGCKNVIGNAVRKLRSEPYYCSMECHEFYQRTTNTTAVESQVLTQIQAVLTEVRETRAEMRTVQRTVSEMEKFQNFLSDKLDALLSEIKCLKVDHNVLKTNVESLASKQHAMDDRVDGLERELDRLNRAAVSKNAIIIGMPMKNNEDPVQMIYNVAAAVGCQLPEGAIVEARRLLPKNSNPTDARAPPIKVCFSDICFKEDLFAKKKSRGSVLSTDVDSSIPRPGKNIILRDELTAFGMKLLGEVKEAQPLLECKFIWPGRNGAILVKRTDNSRIEIIRSHKDLEKLEKSSLKRQLNANSTSNSISIQEPTPKRRQ